MKDVSTFPANIQGAIPADVMTKLQAAMAGVESGLIGQDPELKNHLRESHRLLISYPETVHLLDDSEIAHLLDAAQKLTTVQIVSDTAKGKGGGKKKGVGTVDDL